MAARTHLVDYRPIGGREAPPRLLELLREIDPRAELLYAGSGIWMLGVYNPNQHTARMALKMIRNLRKLAEVAGHGAIVVPRHVKTAIAFKLWRYQLNLMGFRPITRYVVQGEPGSWVYEDFRERDYRYRMNLDQELRRIEDDADEQTRIEEQQDALFDYLEKTGTDAVRHAFHSKVISIPGQRPGLAAPVDRQVVNRGRRKPAKKQKRRGSPRRRGQSMFGPALRRAS